MIVNKKAKALYNRIFDGIETFAANSIVRWHERIELCKNVRHLPRLSAAQRKAVRDYWRPYGHVNTDWVRYYTNMTGVFDVRYIPNDREHTAIDQYFNARKLGWGFNDKNYYSLLFPGIKQPTTVVRKIGGLFFNEAYEQMQWEEVKTLLAQRSEVIVKPSQESGGGRDIHFYNTQTQAEELHHALLDTSFRNLIVQDIVHQHSELAKMHPQSLNTIRIYTLMLEDGVHILNASFKMGAGDSRIDNVTRNAGIIAGIKADGRLTSFALFDLHSTQKTDHHPQGMPLSEIHVPSFDKMLATAKRAAQYTGNFQLVGWDFSVDEQGEVILIEANMRKGDIGPIQCLHGPFFGELTEQVLNHVFHKQ